MFRNYKCCFATVITKSEYEVTAGRLYQSFKYLGSEFPFEILVTDNLSDLDIPFLIQNSIPFRKVELLQFNENKNNFFWQDTASKFNALILTEYDYICFIDADTAINDLLDKLMYLFVPFDKQFKMLRYAEVFPDGCLFFMKPSLEVFSKIKSYIKQSDCFTDEQIIYYYFNDCITYIEKSNWEHLTTNLLHFSSPFKIYNFDVGNIIRIFKTEDISVYLNKINEIYAAHIKLKEAFVNILNI